MGKAVTASAAAAVAIILLNLCPSSYGKDAVAASLHSNNDERRSLRKGLAVATNEKSNDIKEEATQQSVKFHTKLSEAAATSTIKKNRVAEALNNKFFDMSDLTEKEVSSRDNSVLYSTCLFRLKIICVANNENSELTLT